MRQNIITAGDNYRELDEWINERGARKILLVCRGAVNRMESFQKHLEELEKHVEIIKFSAYQSNPLYESAAAGVVMFRMQSCDAIIAAGGGSTMDVAKCIKLFSNMRGEGEDGGYLKQKIVPNTIPFLAMPTTAGSGSEATRYAVIYYLGEKQSIMSESFIPDTVLMDSGCLETLSAYQKKVSMLDAFCHALESFWSINSTDESKRYSRDAIGMILENMEGYLANTDDGNRNMLMASYMAGKAINIAQTTAGHAMCYKITGLFGIAHGHAAILCDRALFSRMIQNKDKCIDPRGEEYLERILLEIAHAMGEKTAKDAAEKIGEIFDRLKLDIPTASRAQFEELKMSVNPVRLKNHPVELSVNTIDMLYHKILR